MKLSLTLRLCQILFQRIFLWRKKRDWSPGIGLLGARLYPLTGGLQKLTIVTMFTNNHHQYFIKVHHHRYHNHTELEDTPASLYSNVNLHFTFVPLIFFVFHPVDSEHWEKTLLTHVHANILSKPIPPSRLWTLGKLCLHIVNILAKH